MPTAEAASPVSSSASSQPPAPPLAAIRVSGRLPKMIAVVVLLVLAAGAVRGEIHCMCNTPDCHSSGVTSCVAKYYCFIEYKAVAGHYRPTYRGCIDHRTPLNCEQFVPQDPSGRTATIWPYLYCCSDGWCNIVKDRWRQYRKKQKQKRKKKRPFHKPKTTSAAATTSRGTTPLRPTPNSPSRPKFRGRAPPLSPNPAHIAVPVAGAFFLLSLIVLVVILVRRKEADDGSGVRSTAGKYHTVPPAAQTKAAAAAAAAGGCYNPYADAPVALYASVGHKQAYPLCPVVPRAPL